MANSDTTQRDLWLTRLYYVFLPAGGFVVPYLNLFYTRLNLTGVEIGTVGATSAVITLLTAPLWANRAERSDYPRRLLQISLLLTALANMLLGNQTVALGVLALTAFNALASSGLQPLSDGLAVSVTHGRRSGFGSVRIFASIGWVIFVPIGGLLAENVSIVLNFYACALVLMLAALMAGQISPRNFVTRTEEIRASFSQVLKTLRGNLPMLGYALTLVIVGFANNGILQFESVFLDKLGASESAIGIISILGAVVEVPMMLLADRLLNHFRAYWLLLISLLMTVALRGLVFLAPSIEMIAFTRLVAGISFSFWIVAGIRYITHHTAAHERRTVMALFNVSLVGLVSIVASPGMGAVYDAVGLRPLYGVAAVGYFVGAVVMFAFNRQKSTSALSKNPLPDIQPSNAD